MKTKTKKPKEEPQYSLTQEQKDYVDKAYKEGRILAKEIDLTVSSKEDLLDALINNERLLQNQQRRIEKLVKLLELYESNSKDTQ
jgi:hypothetical protein